MNTSNAGSSGPLHVVSARLPTGDTPVAGVPLVPYVLVRRGVAGDSSASAALGAPVSGDDAPDEETALATGSSRFALRFRWYRSVLLGGAGRGGMPAVCWAHPDREAAIQVRGEVGLKREIEFLIFVVFDGIKRLDTPLVIPLFDASFLGSSGKRHGARVSEEEGRED